MASVKKSIARQYIHILLMIVAILSILYLVLFTINRIQYIKHENALNEKEIMQNVIHMANTAKMTNARQMHYFIDYAKLLEFAFNSNNAERFIRQNETYAFVGIANKNGKFIHSNNSKLAQILDFEPYNAKNTIKSKIVHSSKMLTTYRILSYPIVRNNDIFGYIVVYLDLDSLINLRKFYLIDKDSYVLNDIYFNDIFIGNKNLSFIYHDVWVQMQLDDEGQLVDDNGIFTYRAIYPETHIGDYRIETGKLYFLSFIPIDKYDSPYYIDNIASFIKYANFREQIFYWIVGYVYILFTCVFLYIITIGRIKNNLSSNTCQLTGAFNRHNGFELLNTMIRDYDIASKNAISRFLAKFVLFRKLPTTLHICLVDIDNLKMTNDKLGHKMGDELIAVTIHTIKRHLRRGDIIIRIGGDEFLVVLINRSMQEIDILWQKIYDDFLQKNKRGKYKFNIQVSKGVIEYQKGMNVESCIIEADKLMYQEKKTHKINLFFD